MAFALASACGGSGSSGGPVKDGGGKEGGGKGGVGGSGLTGGVGGATGGSGAVIDASSEDAPTEASQDAGSGPVELSNSSTSFTEAEVQLAVAADGTIAVAWMAYAYSNPFVRIGYRFSTDGGQTFTPAKYFVLPNALSAVDPAITVDPSGNFYVSMVGADYSASSDSGIGNASHVYVAKATKGSTSFGTPIEVTDPPAIRFYDHPKIMATKQGTILVTYLEMESTSSSSNLGIAARSTDGINWQRSTMVGLDPVYANLFWVCEGNAILYATYLEYDMTTTQYGVVVRSSIDEGVTWSTTSTYVSTYPSELPAGMDPACVATGDQLWVSYGTTTNPQTGAETLDPADKLQVAHSLDRGATFPTRVEALDAAAGVLALHPVLIRESGGALDLAYLSAMKFLDPAATLRFVRAPSSSFGPSVAVDGPFVFQLDRTGYDWLGDYIGAVEHAGSLYFAYPKNVGGKSHVWFAKSPAQ